MLAYPYRVHGCCESITIVAEMLIDIAGCIASLRAEDWQWQDKQIPRSRRVVLVVFEERKADRELCFFYSKRPRQRPIAAMRKKTVSTRWFAGADRYECLPYGYSDVSWPNLDATHLPFHRIRSFSNCSMQYIHMKSRVFGEGCTR